jgi:translocation protein SEC63
MVHLALRGMLGITAAQFWFMPSVQCLELSKMLLQAVPSAWTHTESSELHQLPHMNAEQIKTLRTKKKQLKSAYQLLALPAEERTSLLKDVNLTDAHIADLLAVARRIPKVSIVSAEFVCMGEDSITPESLVTLVVRLRATTQDQPINALKVPDAYLDDSKDDDEEEDLGNEGDDERTGRMSKLTKLLSGSYWQNPNDPIHCPYFPQAESEEQLKRPTYWMWLAAPRNNRVVGPPVRINKLVPVMAEEKDPKKGVKTVKFSFLAPQTPGMFSFTVYVDGDVYLGMEVSQDVKLVVRPVDQAELEQRNKRAKDAWKDFDEDEELTAAQNPFSLGGAVSTSGGGDDSSSDSDSSSSDSD